MPKAKPKKSASTKAKPMSACNCNCAKINPLALGFAIGKVCALLIFLTGISAWLFGYGSEWVYMISTVYIGYDATFIGALIGAIYAFIDGIIIGALIGFFYNWKIKCC